MSTELALLERILADAMCAEDPVAVIESACAEADVPDAVRAQLQCVDADGLRLAGLLVVRLRFERVVAGSMEARQHFESEPAEFASLFKLYHTSQSPDELMPSEEGAKFDEWNRSRPDL